MRQITSMVVFLMAWTGALRADIIFTLGNNPSNDVNILLSSGASGTTVTGSPSGFPGIVVDFTSTQTLLEPSSGQARVSANPEGTPLTNLDVSLANGLTYADLIINPFVGGSGVCPNCTGGPATITVNPITGTGQAEAPAVFTYSLGSGNNFLTIVASGGESIASTVISVPGGINDLRQPRISGPFLAPVPEPSTLALLGTGLAAIIGAKRRKLRL